MFNSNSTTNVLIGLALTRTASVVVNDVTSGSYLADGEVLVLDKDGAVMAAGTTFTDSEYITVVQRSGATAATSELIQSQRIYGLDVTKYRGASYSGPQEQRYFVGYDGSTSSIDAQDNNDYVLRIMYKHNKDMFSQQANVSSYYYTSDASALQHEIADAFAVRIGDDTSAEVTCERVTDATTSSIGVSGAFTVVKGSKSISAATDIDNGGMVVGDHIVLDGVAYKVATLDTAANTATLDQAYQGASGTVAQADASFITAANADAAASDWGLRITGEAETFTVGKLKYNKVAFDLSLGEFGATVVNEFREAARGRGTYEQVAELEWFAQGFDGATDKFGDSAATARADAISGTEYDVISILSSNSAGGHMISGEAKAGNQLIIALPVGTLQGNALLSVLNPWMASLPKAFANVTV